jgi:hypothetical protein
VFPAILSIERRREETADGYTGTGVLCLLERALVDGGVGVDGSFGSAEPEPNPPVPQIHAGDEDAKRERGEADEGAEALEGVVRP